MPRVTSSELDRMSKEFLEDIVSGVFRPLNWTSKLNSELVVGDKIVTQFDKQTRKALKGAKITKIENPRGCPGKSHIWTEDGNNGCYDWCASTPVFLSREQRL